MARTFKVTSQGIKADVSKADGSYDNVVIGEMDSDRLYEILRRFEAIREIKPTGNEDICPPSLYIEHDGKDYSFYLSGGEIINLNTEAKISPMEIVNLVSGFTTKKEVAQEAFEEEKKQEARGYQTGPGKRSVLAWGSDHPDVKGMQPVRKKDLPPTDKEEWSGFNVDTRSAAQISAEVYKSSGSMGFPTATLLFGIVSVVLALGLFVTGEAVPGVIFLLVAVGLFVLTVVLKKSAREAFNLGFDWKANAMWAKKKGDKQAILIANANCITAIDVYEHTTARPYHLNPGDTSMERAVKKSIKDKSWILEVIMSNGERRFGYEFLDKKDADDVLGKARNLLSQQN